MAFKIKLYRFFKRIWIKDYIEQKTTIKKEYKPNILNYLAKIGQCATTTIAMDSLELVPPVLGK